MATQKLQLRVCLVTEIFHPEDQGGQGQQAFALARRLQEQGVGVTVATRRNFPGSTRRDVLDGIPIERLPPSGLLKGKGWKAVLPTLRFLTLLGWHLLRTRHNYDVILVQGTKGILLPPLLVSRLCGKHCVIKIDALAELEQDLTPESLAEMGLKEATALIRAWSRLRNALLRSADAPIAISAEIEAALRRRLGPTTPIANIPNGLDLQRLQERPADTRALRQQLGLPDGVLVTYTGRLSRAKGLMMLLQAWSSVARRHPDAHLVLVGSGDRSFDGCEEQLREYVRDAQLEHRVIFTGHVPDVAGYLHASDLFVQSSDSEGFGLSLIEAMAAGLPCVSTAVGVAPEVIVHDRNGWLVPPRDEPALQGALEIALTARERWRPMGLAAQQAVTSRFDLEHVAASYVELFTYLASPTSSETAVPTHDLIESPDPDDHSHPVTARR